MGDWVVGGRDVTVQELRDAFRRRVYQCKSKARVDKGMVFCTRPVHPDREPHVAGTGAVIVHVWREGT